ncbi:MAG: cytochrome C [Elusimicrobia bacterium CG_4_10_14_0_2_um_filter_56_8]|nr:MAG: cytochrome C [Elusimicrobia bacterium CG1_02_56_21]PJA16621.1 MAG: cytochrome C [Elusimicrobia bacterium CG_4_10_14_0_2_um_filter_56_8]
MKNTIIIIASLCLLFAISIGVLSNKDIEPGTLTRLKAKYSQKHVPSADHTKFTALQKKFTSPRQVTEACIGCHNKRHEEVMRSAHWNWEKEEYIEGRGVVYLGKKNAINNFCISTPGNEKSCAKCHIGYGMDSKGTEFSDRGSVDCLVCHDNSETYTKAPDKGGAPLGTLDLNLIAQSVGKPKRTNCGVCHFFGGGGNNVKHGDLEKALFEPDRDLDVHMASAGQNLQCVDCHKTEKHNISGKMYSLSSMNQNRSTCEQCHTAAPHADTVLNEHTVKVACQTCHIPAYAKANATKMYWDWSTAGKLKNGKPYAEEDSMGNHSYMSIKGSFVWKKNVKPDYIWFNGTASHYLSGDKVDDKAGPLVLNPLHGSYADENSKIIPVKIHVANQPYDPENKILIQPRLFSENKGEGAFWKDFNWVSAARAGMKAIGLPFSGKVSFIKTEMYWPLNHMVAPKESSVKCSECHIREGGRLAGLNDFYMPGRDYSRTAEFLGKWLLLLSLLGVLAHGAGRIISRRKRITGENK